MIDKPSPLKYYLSYMYMYVGISDIRRICDIEFSFTFNEDTGTMATALCTGCNLTVYNATGPMIITGSFPIKLMVNYSYEATCQLTTSDDNCLQSVKYIGSLRAGTCAFVLIIYIRTCTCTYNSCMCTVEPLLTDPPRSGPPLYNGHYSRSRSLSH